MEKYKKNIVYFIKIKVEHMKSVLIIQNAIMTQGQRSRMKNVRY